MNRSILIVICDFLLVSLLAFSSVDVNKVTENGSARTALSMNVRTNQGDVEQDLTAVMRLALAEEHKNREQLLGQLAQTRNALNEQQSLFKEQQSLLSEREQQVQTFRQQLESRQQESQRLQQQLESREKESQRLQQQQNGLQNQFATAQTNLQSLNQQLQSASAEAVLSKEKLAAMEAEMRRQSEQAAALQRQLAQLASSNQMVLNERQKLATQLQVAEVERRHATEQVARMTEEVKVERDEKAKLAEGVKALASKSGQLAQEIRENRPLASNTIFNEFVTNRVQAQFTASRAGLFGNEATSRDLTQTIVVTDGTNYFALCHVQNTPLSFGNAGTDWGDLTGTLARNAVHVSIRTLSFGWPDPRVVLIRLTSDEVRALGCQVYRVSSDPFKFQDAVLVGAREGYYGECRFEIDVTTPDYVKLDRSVLRGLFGKFNPTRGDLVFSRNGELLGVMANSTYCLMIRRFDSAATVRLDNDMRAQHTGAMLAQLSSQVNQMPVKLQ